MVQGVSTEWMAPSQHPFTSVLDLPLSMVLQCLT